jgi:hypothetical protein
MSRLCVVCGNKNIWSSTIYFKQLTSYHHSKNAVNPLLARFGWFMVFNTIFSYIMATSFSGGRIRSTRREPPTMGKQLVNFIICGWEPLVFVFILLILVDLLTISFHNTQYLYQILHIVFIYSGFLQGKMTAIPHHISFQPKYDNGAVLTVVSVADFFFFAIWNFC